MKFSAKVSVSKGFSPGVVAQTVRTAVQNYGRRVADSYNETTENWHGDKPQFGRTQTQVSPSTTPEIKLTVGIVGGSVDGIKKWGWLDEGTAIRYATMNKKFKPKTRPGTTKTGPGRGPYEPNFVTKDRPQPGITARDWSGIILRRHQKGGQGVKSFYSAMQKAVAEGVDKSAL